MLKAGSRGTRGLLLRGGPFRQGRRATAFIATPGYNRAQRLAAPSYGSQNEEVTCLPSTVTAP